MPDMPFASDAASVPVEEHQTLDLVHQLLQSFQDGPIGMAFACGGIIPIPVASNTAHQYSTTSDRATTCQPVTLRWDPSSKSVPASECKLQFPLDESDRMTVHNMQQLVHDMQHACFGYQSPNVLAGSYFKAYKLDPSNFACTFSPHELGIVDGIARVLLPGFKDHITSTNEPVCAPQNKHIEHEHVMRAELYKLNVYVGPLGHFRAHVDTPRSSEQIGSLIVCLPSVHEGGQLQVRHEGRTITFDWSMPGVARPEIQWAAFYSDCEPKVLPVTSGHRITLTYNLYATPNKGIPRVAHGLIDATKLPLYDILHKLFLQENFMPDGGYMGVHTSHAYPHTSGSPGLPSTLKGADVVAWETFRSLGCDVSLRPVVELPGWAHYGHEDSHLCPNGDLTDISSEGSHSHTDDEALSIPPSESGHEETRPDEVEPSQVFDLFTSGADRGLFEVDLPMRPLIGYGISMTGANDMADPGKDDDGDCPMAEASQVPHAPSDSGSWGVDDEEIQALHKENEEVQALPRIHFTGIEPSGLLLPRREDDEDEEATADRFEQHGVRTGCLALGNGLSFHAEPNLVEGEGEMKQMLDRWIEQKPQGQAHITQQPIRVRYEEVAWLNHSGLRKEPQISYAVYGNEAEAATMYSTCGIVALVPRLSTRRALLGKEYR